MKTLIILATLLFSVAVSADVYLKIDDIKGESEDKAAAADEVAIKPDRIEASAARTVTNTGEETATTEAVNDIKVDTGEKHRPETVDGKSRSQNYNSSRPNRSGVRNANGRPDANAKGNSKVTLGDLPCSNSVDAADNKCSHVRKEQKDANAAKRQR